MEFSRTAFARSGDVHIAFQVVGDGPVDLIAVPAGFGHLETYWEEPHCARFYRGLAAFARVAIFDNGRFGFERGVGVR